MTRNEEILKRINKEREIKIRKANNRHILLGILFFVLTLFLFGCSAKEQVVYRQHTQEVFIPIKCNIKPPVAPKETGDVVKDNINLMAYLRNTEQVLQACIKEE